MQQILMQSASAAEAYLAKRDGRFFGIVQLFGSFFSSQRQPAKGKRPYVCVGVYVVGGGGRGDGGGIKVGWAGKFDAHNAVKGQSHKGSWCRVEKTNYKL